MKAGFRLIKTITKKPHEKEAFMRFLLTEVCMKKRKGCLFFGLWLTAAQHLLPCRYQWFPDPRWRTAPRRYAPCQEGAYTVWTDRCRRRWCRAACLRATFCGRAGFCGHRSLPFSAVHPERLRRHGYPWRKFPERYPEQRYRTAGRRLTASHHSPENGCHGARRSAAYRQSA